MLATVQINNQRKIVKTSTTNEKKPKIVKGEAPQENILMLDENYDLKEFGVESGISALTPTLKTDARANMIDITAAIISDPNYVETSSKTLKASTYKMETDKLIPFTPYELPADVKRVTGETIKTLKANPQLLLEKATNFVHVMKVFSITDHLQSEFHFGFKRKQSSNAKTDGKKKSVSCTHVVLFFTYAVNLIDAQGNAICDAERNPLYIPKFCRLTFKLHSAADKVYRALPEGTKIDMQFPTLLTATNSAWTQYKRENAFSPKSNVVEPQMSIEACNATYEIAVIKCALKVQEIETYLQTIQTTQIAALRWNKKENKNSRKRKASQEDFEEEELAPMVKVNKTETTTSASSSLIPEASEEEVPAFNLNMMSNMEKFNANTLQQQINSEDAQQLATNLDWMNALGLFNQTLIPTFNAGQQFDLSFQPQSILPQGLQVLDFSAYLGQIMPQQQQQQESIAQPMGFSQMMTCDLKQLLN